ncbi:ABC-2 transporter permease [Leucobacter massiliensis]|uniref:ABC-2 transporter permease n=1 Tax=Leucobacter massiliensis TaxID=1686285 RepID=A0A2S9QRZ3_9MICO|nr:ABC-2 transporter permease [Leucobacter massiliensis]PRI12360.1 hypothetical protein B4915_01395 [Leucobacter massiliensis]
MTVLARRIGLDLRSLRPYARQGLFALVIIFLPVLVSPEHDTSGMVFAAVVLAAAIGPQYLFSNDERGRLDTLYAALGVPRARTVWGRYASCLLLVIGLAAVALLLSWGLAEILGSSLDLELLGPLAVGGIALAGLVMCVQLPVFFAVGFTRARPITFLALALVVAAFLAPALLSPELAAAALEWVAGASAGILMLLALLVLAVAVAGSAAVSVRLYARRDL